MFRERIIVEGSLAVDEDGYSLRARIPWYRALPLSCLVEVTVTVDGRTAEPGTVTVATDGVECSLAEAARTSDRSWYVLDDLVVRVAGARLPDRAQHEVDLTLGLRIPYLPVLGRPLEVREHFSTTMPAKELTA